MAIEVVWLAERFNVVKPRDDEQKKKHALCLVRFFNPVPPIRSPPRQPRTPSRCSRLQPRASVVREGAGELVVVLLQREQKKTSFCHECQANAAGALPIMSTYMSGPTAKTHKPGLIFMICSSLLENLCRLNVSKHVIIPDFLISYDSAAWQHWKEQRLSGFLGDFLSVHADSTPLGCAAEMPPSVGGVKGLTEFTDG